MVFNQVPKLAPELSANTVVLQDCKLFYTQGGMGLDTTPMLLLHGWGISAEPYHEILKLLVQQYPVLAPDLPSFGRSFYPTLIPDYESYAKLILAFLDALNLSQVHLVGHSLGGGIAITLSALVPDRVKSLVLIDSTGIPSMSLPEAIPRRAIEMTAQLFLPGLQLKLVDIPQVFSYNLLFNTGNVVQALLLSLQADLKHLLPDIQAPSLLLWSEKDLTTPLSVAQEMALKIANSRLITVEEGWHEWGLWYPEKIVALMLKFLHSIEEIQVSPAHYSNP